MSVDQALSKAKSYLKKDEFAEAQKLYQAVLLNFPQNIRAQQGLALLNNHNKKIDMIKIPPQEEIDRLVNLYNQGQFLVLFEKAKALLDLYPYTFIVWNILGVARYKLGMLDEAVEAYKKTLLLKPNYAEAYTNMGTALKDQGKFEEAIQAYKKSISLKPDYAEAYSNMGNALKDQNKLEKAIEAYKKCISLKPDYAVAYNNLGNALKDKSKYREAIEAFKKALLLKPNYYIAHNNLGNALKDQGKLDEAVKSYKKALLLKPDYPEAYNNLGITLKKQDKFDEAIAAYKQALLLKSDYIGAWLNGAETLEQWNKLEKLELWLDKAYRTLEPVPSGLQILKSNLLWRTKRFNEAYDLITNIDFETVPNIQKRSYLVLKAKCYEKHNDFDNAFHCFSKSNLLAKQSNEYVKYNPDKYFQNLKNQLITLETRPNRTSIINSIKKDNFNPVFLVGFPRSGTTLLDTILRSHSKIEVVEEQPAVTNTISFLKKNGHNDLTSQISPELLEESKIIYKEEFAKHITKFNLGYVYIDKLPLNIVNIPLIQQLYPGSKFILALRHPMDTILSCWMQDFKLNQGMANMVDLNRIVEFYNVAMNIFKTCRTKYSLNIYEIKYEDLLDNLSGKTTTLLKFLDLKWEPQMQNYKDTALKRGRINTPSYSQVVQPIYKDAKYRWINYKKYLDKYLHEVGPWINQFGYDSHH